MFDLSESDMKTKSNRENGIRTRIHHIHNHTCARLCHYACVFACIQFDHVSKYWFVATHQPMSTICGSGFVVVVAAVLIWHTKNSQFSNFLQNVFLCCWHVCKCTQPHSQQNVIKFTSEKCKTQSIKSNIELLQLMHRVLEV